MANQSYKILHLEDSPEHARLVSDFLTMKGDYSIYWVNDIHDFWEMLDLKKFDLIIMDYRLPDGTGLDVLQNLQEKEYDIPVIMVTGQGDEKIAVKALRFGASDYLVKSPDYFLGLHSLIQKTIGESKLKKVILQSYQKIRYQALLLKNIQDALIVWNVNGKITYWNIAAEELFGFSAEQMIGQNVHSNYFSIFDRPIKEDDMFHLLGQETERMFETRDMKNVWISSRVMELHDRDSNTPIIGFIDVVRDITKRKKVEAELELTREKLMESTRLKTIGELSTGIAHRIFNPLTSVIANTQLLQRELSDQELCLEILKDIEKAGWQAQETVSKLMLYSKPMRDDMEQISIGKSLEEALALIGEYMQASNIDVEYQSLSELPEVNGNFRQMVDLWVNLFMAARNSMLGDQANNIWVSAEVKDDIIFVRVEDNGLVNQDIEIEQVFEPNFIGSGENRESGLEYSICREIVRQHGGEILIAESQKNFIIEIKLPLNG